MRAALADAALAGYTGRFVWLELDFDAPRNQSFLTEHGVAWTPAFYVLDPTDGRAAAMQIGSMTRPELDRFLEQGERGVGREPGAPAEAALARADEQNGAGALAAAAAGYREA